MKSFYGLTSAPRAWWLDITQKLSQLGWKPIVTDQCLWCRYSDDGELKGVIEIHVDDFLIGLADGILGEKWMSEMKSLYRWGSWKVSESEFAGIRVRQHRDFSITIDLEDYTNKFITEAPITRERSRQRQESLTTQELSMLRGVLGPASWRAQQMSPQFAADVSLLLSATADPEKHCTETHSSRKLFAKDHMAVPRPAPFEQTTMDYDVAHISEKHVRTTRG